MAHSISYCHVRLSFADPDLRAFGACDGYGGTEAVAGVGGTADTGWQDLLSALQQGPALGPCSSHACGDASYKNRGEDLIPVLVARDRSGAAADFLLEAVSMKCLSEALSPRVKADAIL